MPEFIYEELRPHRRDEIISMLSSNEINTCIQGILIASIFDPDIQWTTDLCFKYLMHNDISIKKSALTGLSHIVRIHKTIDSHKVAILLEQVKHLPELSGPISDLLDDIAIFMHKKG